MDTAGWKKSKLTTHCVNKKNPNAIQPTKTRSSAEWGRDPKQFTKLSFKQNNQTNNLQYQQYFILF